MWIYEGTVSRPGSFSIFSPFQAYPWSAPIVAAFLWSFNHHLLLRGLLSRPKTADLADGPDIPSVNSPTKMVGIEKSDPTNSSKREETEKGFRM